MEERIDFLDPSLLKEWWGDDAYSDGLDNVELDRLAEQAEAPDLSDPLLYFLPKRQKERPEARPGSLERGPRKSAGNRWSWLLDDEDPRAS